MKVIETAAVATVALSASLCWCTLAHAEGKDDGKLFALGIDGQLTAAINAGNQPLGGGFGARAGLHYSTPTLFAIRPEVGGSYTRLLDEDIGRLHGGLRLGAEFLLGVYAYGHGGYGWNGPAGYFTWDVGAAVDYRLFPIVNPGVHLEYVNWSGYREAVNAGIHVEFLAWY